MTGGSSTTTTTTTPEDKNQLLVKTPYGKGLVIRTRRPGVTVVGRGAAPPVIKEVKLLEWENAVKTSRRAAGQFGGARSSKSPLMLYTSDELESVEPSLGDDVICQWGRGRVTNVVKVRIVPKKKKNEGGREATPEGGKVGQEGRDRVLTKYEVELTSWRLNSRSRVKCYLYPPSLQVVRKKMLGEMTATERVEFAQRQKLAAMKAFRDKQYQAALNVYSGAVDAVRYVQHDAHSTNETRADLVEVMVTCSNNAATCCVQLARWDEAAKFAQNALVLLDALLGKIGLKIHTILTGGSCGLCDAKLFGEWRVKSYLVIARSQAEKKDYAGSIEILKRAREIIAGYCGGNDKDVGGGSDEDGAGKKSADEAKRVSIVHLRSQDKEVRRLMTSCIERKKAEKKKERQRAQAMFGGGGGGSPASKPGEKSSTRGSVKMAAVEDGEGHEEKKDASSPAPKSASTRNGGVGIESSRADDVANCATPPKPNRSRTLPRQSSLRKKNRPRPLASADKRVSFSSEVAEREIGAMATGENDYDDVEEDEEETFLEQNKEALILVGIAGLAAISAVALRRFKR